MKTIHFLIIVLLLLCSCKKEVKLAAQPANFGVYETVRVTELPDHFIHSLNIPDLQPEKDTLQPIIGYVLQADSAQFEKALTLGRIRVAISRFTVDADGKYCALVALKDHPVITLADIRKTRRKSRDVEIFFNQAGAKKWAEMTEDNTGKKVAFVVDDRVYSLPLIHARINYGVALINGLESEAAADRLSAYLSRQGNAD
jgi:hypothetical protein